MEISKKHKIPYEECKDIYANVFKYMISEFAKITHTNEDTWNSNFILKNFGKFVINKSKLRKYGNVKTKTRP
jgi:nucleoid DNA-binding protein